LLVSVLYVKEQGGQRFAITDGSMTDLIRPALYDAVHPVIPVRVR
jgi:diaminopimelate decarboxylase